MGKTNVLLMIFIVSGKKKKKSPNPKLKVCFLSSYYVKVISDLGFWSVYKSRKKKIT